MKPCFVICCNAVTLLLFLLLLWLYVVLCNRVAEIIYLHRALNVSTCSYSDEIMCYLSQILKVKNW